jgi:hypothetical protein
MTLASAIGCTALAEYPPGVEYLCSTMVFLISNSRRNDIKLTQGVESNPSTQGSGRNVLRFIPITLIMVLIAETPSHPDFRATLAGCTALSQEMRGKMSSKNETN